MTWKQQKAQPSPRHRHRQRLFETGMTGPKVLPRTAVNDGEQEETGFALLLSQQHTAQNRLFSSCQPGGARDRKRAEEEKSGSERVDRGCRGLINKKKPD